MPLKLYIAVLDEVPSNMVPVLVAHSILGAHLEFSKKWILDNDRYKNYKEWLEKSYKKCVLKVNKKEFDKISRMGNVYLGHENTVLNATKSCVVVFPEEQYPNVIKFAKLWVP